jgi:hypothetical protein
MADYSAFPLWWEEPDQVGDIDPATLPLTQATIEQLEQWATTYDETLNHVDPAASGFASEQDADLFERSGILLWQRLREELGTAYEVWYFSNQRQRLFKNPDEIDAMTL